MKHQAPLVVEAIGLPGAGKTTFVDSLASIARSPLTRAELYSEFSTRSKLQRVVDLLVHMAPGSLFQSAQYANQIRRKSAGSTAIALSLPYHEAVLSKFRKRTNRMILLDQWTIQTAWSVTVGFDPKISETSKYELLKRYLSRQPRFVFYLESSPKLAAHRISRRPHGESRFDGLEESAILQKLTNEMDNMLRVLDFLHAYDVPVLQLQASLPTEDQVTLAKEWLMKMGSSEDDWS